MTRFDEFHDAIRERISSLSPEKQLLLALALTQRMVEMAIRKHSADSAIGESMARALSVLREAVVGAGTSEAELKEVTDDLSQIDTGEDAELEWEHDATVLGMIEGALLMVGGGATTDLADRVADSSADIALSEAYSDIQSTIITPETDHLAAKRLPVLDEQRAQLSLVEDLLSDKFSLSGWLAENKVRW